MKSAAATFDRRAARATLDAALARLLAERTPAGAWEGRLSSSALSTATAVVAIGLAGRAGVAGIAGEGLDELARGGIAWLAAHQNDDGGWGDTPDSPSNLSTTALCWAALGWDGDGAAETTTRAESWLQRAAGGVTPERLGRAIELRYGSDRTFSVPILTLCALAGRFGAGPEAWRAVPAVPFELAALPRRSFRLVGLPMVSYALPALIATGQAIHHHRPSGNPLARAVRNLARDRTLRILAGLQPPSGGFIEAIPLTSFVVMSLLACGEDDHPVVAAGLRFLRRAVRDDGSWPIDSDLATWVTTLSINALATAGRLGAAITPAAREDLLAFLLQQQYHEVHPYTDAPPGGWAWTPRSGGVPDADDTPGALLALANLLAEPAADARRADGRNAAVAGVTWLLDLQNRDGGIPTFCRGWSKLPFDRSGPDLTAHALRAWQAWRAQLPAPLGARVDRAAGGAARFLVRAQRTDGAWVPLWFGNQAQAEEQNPMYGTTRVLLAPDVLPAGGAVAAAWQAARRRAIAWVLAAQRPEGGFGADGATTPTIEETAMAVEALARLPERDQRTHAAMARGCAWLLEATAGGQRFDAAPIGLYFARLWYSERLYPLIFTVAALGAALHAAPSGGDDDG